MPLLTQRKDDGKSVYQKVKAWLKGRKHRRIAAVPFSESVDPSRVFVSTFSLFETAIVEQDLELVDIEDVDQEFISGLNHNFFNIYRYSAW